MSQAQSSAAADIYGRFELNRTVEHCRRAVRSDSGAVVRTVKTLSPRARFG